MTIRRKMALPALGALLVLGLMVVAQSATATHVRPKAATPFYASTVPSYQPCVTPNRVHAAPLAYSSCNPPVQTSPNVTVGSPDANGAAANSVGFIKLVVTNGPGAADADVAITANISDVRCQGATVACGAANAAAGPDYVGALLGTASLNITDVRCQGATVACGAANAAAGPDYVGALLGTASLNITDHNNSDPLIPGDPFDDPATGTQPAFPVVTTCAATAATTAGSTCSAATTANSTAPGAITEGKRGIVEISQLRVFDGGPDGTPNTGNESLFEVQGIFIP
jgi:hypothetical protein